MTATLTLKRAFCAAVLLLAVWRFSENTADPDLWGHVRFGERMLSLGHIEMREPFSWTAQGEPWVNHEVGAELTMGITHWLFGGPGLLLLALTAGLATFWLAIRMGADGLKWPRRAVPWAIALLAAKEIAFGFSVRPQIFTALALVGMIWVLRKVHAGDFKWGLALPLLFVVWINTHGGALAGFCLLVVAATATTAQFIGQKRSFAKPLNLLPANAALVTMLWFAAVASFNAMLVNPWNIGLIKWLVGSVLWFRPEIAEWNPPALGVEHAGTFALVVISLFAFACSRRQRWLWEIAIVAVLAVISLRHVRHIPLFAIAALALVPPHLADALERFAPHFENLLNAFQRPARQWALTVLFIAAIVAMEIATFTYHKSRFYTIEVPRDEYPVAAIQFIRQHDITGKMITFFDWGEQCIWELPQSRVSIDGRLDTCYPRDLLREHWNFYDGKPVNPTIFNWAEADYALLRTDVAGIITLKRAQWRVVYQDPLSVILVRDPRQFPKLHNMSYRGSMNSLLGRDPFPSAQPQPRRQPTL